MSTNTTYYNLVKPSGADFVDITVLDTNMDTIDTALHSHDTRLTAVETPAPIISKSANQDVVNSTVMVDDLDLVTPALAIGKWELIFEIGASSLGAGSTTMAWQFTFPAASLAVCFFEGSTNLMFNPLTSGVTPSWNTFGSTANMFRFKLTLNLTASGIVKFQYAQHTADAVNGLRVLAGSQVKYQKVA